jgi:hypothetical protein
LICVVAGFLSVDGKLSLANVKRCVASKNTFKTQDVLSSMSPEIRRNWAKEMAPCGSTRTALLVARRLIEDAIELIIIEDNEVESSDEPSDTSEIGD